MDEDCECEKKWKGKKNNSAMSLGRVARVPDVDICLRSLEEICGGGQIGAKIGKVMSVRSRLDRCRVSWRLSQGQHFGLNTTLHTGGPPRGSVPWRER